MNEQKQNYTFHVQGMHCNACVLMIDSEIGELKNIIKVKSNLKNNSVYVEGNFGNKTLEQIAKEFTILLKSQGYTFSLEKNKQISKLSDFKFALPIAFIFILFFIFLQKSGIINIENSGDISYGTAFFVGIVASLSTCMAIVGGILLSMSATIAKEGNKIRPLILFHGGRIVAFFIIGGIIGKLGSVFTLNVFTTFALGIIIGIVMLILGLNLLDIFPWAKKFQISMPDFIAKNAHGVSKFKHGSAPLLIGIATFFLPCGFTQSMQIYTLTTGSFLKGGFTMLAFVLGTLPVLALISFGSFSIKNSSKSGIFFKTAGLIVITFALFNIFNSFSLIGGFFDFKNINNSSVSTINSDNVIIENGKQIINITARAGYTPRKSVAKAGVPSVIRFNANGTFDCSLFVRIPSLNISKSLSQNSVTDIDIGVQKEKTLKGSCGMGMYLFEISFI